MYVCCRCEEFGIWPDTSGVSMNRTLNQFRFFDSYARKAAGTGETLGMIGLQVTDNLLKVNMLL